MANPVVVVWTRMWVTGRSRPCLKDHELRRQWQRRCASEGFSLIEVLVVLLVLASVMIVSTLSLRGLQSRGLSLEAERLGARIHAAHEEARLLAQPIRLELDDRGYRFYRNQLGRWQLIEGDDLLRPRAWDALTSWRADASPVGQAAVGASSSATGAPSTATTSASSTQASQAFVLAIGAEPIASPWTLVLLRAEQSVMLQSDGLGPITQQTR